MVHSKFMCPVCGTVVSLDDLDYGSNVQETQCPSGHDVSREWNGPESGDRNRSKPYGWSAWTA